MSEMPNEAPAYDQIAAALAAFQGEMPTVPKSHTATVKSDKGSYSYTYAGLADVTEAAMPILSKHGLSFSTLPGTGGLTGILLHKSGQSLTASLPINGSTPQQVGSSLTYMRRYLLGCMTGLVTDDDDDGQQAQQATKRRPKPQDEPPPLMPTASQKTAQASEKQVKMMGALMGKLHMKDRDLALAYVADVIGHEVASRNDLTAREASAVIDALQKDASDDTPVAP